jgi:hypothetical protein
MKTKHWAGWGTPLTAWGGMKDFLALVHNNITPRPPASTAHPATCRVLADGQRQQQRPPCSSSTRPANSPSPKRTNQNSVAQHPQQQLPRQHRLDNLSEIEVAHTTGYSPSSKDASQELTWWPCGCWLCLAALGIFVVWGVGRVSA